MYCALLSQLKKSLIASADSLCRVSCSISTHITALAVVTLACNIQSTLLHSSRFIILLPSRDKQVPHITLTSFENMKSTLLRLILKSH